MTVKLCQMVDIIKFSAWIEDELTKRGWRPIDLSKASGIDSGSLSRILNKQREPSPKIVISIARAFNLSPEFVFRKAGILPLESNTEDNPGLLEMTNLFKQLSPEDQKQILRVLRGYVRESLRYGSSQKQRNPSNS